MQYVYPAIFYKDKKIEDAWTVDFPDIEVAGTCGYSLYEAMEDAEDTLGYIMCCVEDCTCTNRVGEPTPINQVKVELDEYSTEAFVTLIRCDTDEYRRKLLEEQRAKKSIRIN